MPDPIFSENPLEGYGTTNNQGTWLQFNARNPDEPMLQANGDYNPDAFMHPSDGGTGWKMHISAKTPEAIRQLADLAAEYKIPAFKLAISEQKLEQFQDSSRGQAGKAAVFYYTENGVDGKPIDWKAFAQDAQNILDRNGGAGADVQRDKALPGSDGIFYRHGEDMDGNYRPREGITEFMRERNIDSQFSYNLGNREDPFKDIEIKSGAANVPGYDKIPKDWTVERSKSRGEDFIRRTVDSKDEAKELIAELKEQGIEAAMRTKRGGLLVEIKPDSEDAFRDLQARQAATMETVRSPERQGLRTATPDEFEAYVNRRTAEKAAMDASEARADTLTDSYKPFTKDEARAYFERKIAEREANIAANRKPAGYEVRDNGGAFNMFVSDEYKAMQEEKVPGRPRVDTDNKLVVSANTPEAIAALEKLGAEARVPMFRTEEGKATFYFSDKTANGQSLDWQEFAQKAEAIAEKSGVEKGSAVRYVIEGDENPFTTPRLQKPAMSPAESKEEFDRFRAEFSAEYDAKQAAAKAGRTPIDPNTLDEKTYNRIMNAPDKEFVPVDDKWTTGDDGSVRRPMDSIRSAGKMITALKEAGITATVRENNKAFSIEVPASDAKKFREIQGLQQQREQIYDWQEIQEAAGKPIVRENKLGMPAYEDGKIVWKDSTYPPLLEGQKELAVINANALMAGIKPDDKSIPDLETARQIAGDKIAAAESELAAERFDKLKLMNPAKIEGYNPDDAGNMVTAYKEQIAKLQQPAAKAAANIPETGWQEMTTAKGQALLSYQTGTYEEATALRDALKEEGIKARPMDSNGVYSVRIEGDEVDKFRAMQSAVSNTAKSATPSASERMLNAGENDAVSAANPQIRQEMNTETIQSRDGINYTVLDTSTLDFDSPEAAFGKKTKTTLVRSAKPGEEIITSPGKVEESRVVAKGGEVIFVNQLPDGREDAYIPRDENGTPNGQQILGEKYEAIGDDANGKGTLFRPKGSPSKLLPEVITKPTVIKDAWGPGQHQFLDVGATLKLDNGRVTGIDKTAFDETWSITDKAGNIISQNTQRTAVEIASEKTAAPSASERMLNAGEDDTAPARSSPTANMPEQPIRTVGTEQGERDAKRSAGAPAASETPDAPAMDGKPPATPDAGSDLKSKLGTADEKAGKAGMYGLIGINAGKAVVSALKGNTEEAAQYAAATGTMVGVQAIQTPTVQKAVLEGLAAGTEKIAGKTIGEFAEKGAEKLLQSTLKLGGRQIPVLGAAVSAGFAIKSATDKETLGEGIAEGVAGLGETVGGIGGFATGEIGREVMNLATYAVTFGNYSGDPSLTRMLMKEGESILNPAATANAMVSAKLLPLIEKPELQNKQNVSITTFALGDGSIVSLPKMDTKFPEIPTALKVEMEMGDVPGSTKTAQIMNMRALALQEQASMNPFGSSKFTEMKPMTDKVIEQMEVYQDSARVALDFSKRFNEESRQKLIDTLSASPELLAGRKPEDIVPKLDTGESMGLGKEPKITKEQFPQAYEMLKRSVAEGVNPDDLTSRQQVEILRAALPKAALDDLSIWEKAGAGIGIQSDKYVELNAAREEFNKFQKEQYVPYMDKLREAEPMFRSNEKKMDAFVAELNTIQTRSQLAAKEQGMAPQTDIQAEKLAAFQKTDEYKFAQFKIGNLERGIEGTRAAERKLGKNVDTDEKMEQTLLETRADLLKKQQEFMETGQITRNSFSPAILEPLKPADKQKPAAGNGMDEANMAMAPKPEQKKDSSPMLSEGNTIIAQPKEDEPSKRPEDLAAALAKSGFKSTLGDVAALDMNKKETGQLTSTTLSDGQRQQDGRMA